MIRGIGVDIIEVSRIRRSIEKFGDRFLAKIFTPGEISYCSAKYNMHQHLAARFAAKEAVGKALSTGWAGDFSWKDVEVMNDPSGQPRITLGGRLGKRLETATLLLSISHSDDHVVAVVVIEDPEP
jgi:holo-[acyl-carrier protein] synthase